MCKKNFTKRADKKNCSLNICEKKNIVATTGWETLSAIQELSTKETALAIFVLVCDFFNM